ncbi:uncharacterized protein LOC131875986 [Cryptomeria japonica]|uniref:uncharacterized protein LOC131875986 n=1 Tax=Cryptomeria japonica TaxID=3369 RepID=UPI0027D9FC3D|nr:uncharacterized protein LOC131875986 [Cryptomeria japonica]
MGISKEVVQREREQNILKEEDMAKPKKSKPVSTPLKQPKPREPQYVSTFGVQKLVPPPKPQTTSTGGVEKRKKEKSTRKYVTIEEEMESDEEVREDPLMIKVISEKAVEERVDADKDKDDGEKDEKDESAEVAQKEKGEKKEDQALVTVARDTIPNK